MSEEKKQLCLERAHVIVEDDDLRDLNGGLWTELLDCANSTERSCLQISEAHRGINTGWDQDQALIRHRKLLDEGCSNLGGVTCGGHNESESVYYFQDRHRWTQLGEYPHCFALECIHFGAEGLRLQIQTHRLFHHPEFPRVSKLEYDAICSDGTHLISNGTHLLSPRLNETEPRNTVVDRPPDVQSSKLSAGTIAEIVTGVLVAVGLLVVFILWKRKSRKEEFPFERLSSPSTFSASHDLREQGTSKRGTIIRSYDIDATKVTVNRTIGRGAFGAVYAGEYLGSSVALKALFLGNDDLEDFKSEVGILKNLRHPNIVQLMGITDLPGYGLCTVMEYMENSDLKHLLQQAFTKKISLSWGVLGVYGDTA